MPDNRSNDLSMKDALDLYENGKHRRYSLLFSLNGGAFLVAKLLIGPESVGRLNLVTIGCAMAVLNGIMAYDVFAFGTKMRETWLPDVFTRAGQNVVIVIGVVLVCAWILVAIP